MFKNVRWRIAAMFVLLGSIIYFVLAFFGIAAFYWNAGRSLDQQLRMHASELGHAIDFDGRDPHFRNWLRVVQTEPSRSLASIQIYDRNKILVEKFGPAGLTKLNLSDNEVNGWRVLVSPLKKNDILVGYLQIALPTKYRENSTVELEWTVALLAPFLLLGLGFTSYIVSDAATAPIQENLKMLKRFLADASHELNTPISIIQARAESLERKLSKLPDAPKEDLRIIGEVVERMGKIVNDLMLLAEIEGAVVAPISEIIPVDEFLRQVYAEFIPKFEEKGIALGLGNLPQISLKIPEKALHMIVANLIENAWRYTEPGGRVFITLGLSDTHQALISIEDTGIGIPESNLPFVFERFYRVDSSRSRASGGSGLGLSIVKAMIESCGGSIQIRSKIGKGTTVDVFLPLSH